jgi:hypothetical protein
MPFVCNRLHQVLAVVSLVGCERWRLPGMMVSDNNTCSQSWLSIAN